MDIKNQKDTWNNFVKLVIYGTAGVLVILVLMAIFLL